MTEPSAAFMTELRRQAVMGRDVLVNAQDYLALIARLEAAEQGKRDAELRAMDAEYRLEGAENLHRMLAQATLRAEAAEPGREKAEAWVLRKASRRGSCIDCGARPDRFHKPGCYVAELESRQEARSEQH